MTREVMRYKLNELRMMLNDGEHTEEQGILVEIIKDLDKAEPLSEILDKIEAEIREEYDPTTEGRSVDDTYDSFHWGLRFCLEIIEKYKGVSK